MALEAKCHPQAVQAWQTMNEAEAGGWQPPSEICGVYLAGEKDSDELFEFYKQHQEPEAGNAVRVFAFNSKTEQAFTVEYHGREKFTYHDPNGVIAALDAEEQLPLKVLVEGSARGITRAKAETRWQDRCVKGEHNEICGHSR